MFRRVTSVAVVVVAALLAGCSSGDDDSPVAESGDDDSPVAESGDPTASGSDRPDSVNEDFPVAFPSGWQVDLLGEIGMSETQGAQLLYANDDYDRLIAFYDDWFASQPEEFVSRSDAGDGSVIYLFLGEPRYQVTVTSGYEERGETWAQLIASSTL